MKGLFLLCTMIVMLTIISLPALADTYVAGQVAGTWTLTGSPYMVLADIEIPYGLTLTIQPGVQVKFTGHFKFIAHGTLTAVGAQGDSIFFTHHLPYENYTWAGIYFEATQGLSELRYCVVEWGYAQGVVGQASSKGGGVHVLNTAVNIHDCRFSNNKADVKGAAIYVNNGTCEIYNNNITNNLSYGDGGGLFVDYTTTVNVHDNLIKYNTADNGAGMHLVYSGGTISANNIHHNNATSSNGGGILCDHSAPTIQYNVINHNSSSGSSGTGIYCHHYSSPTILYNEICWNNYTGVYCGDYCSPQIVNNTIFGNNSYAIRTYLNSSPYGWNNIITGNMYGFYISSGCAVTMSFSDIQGGWPGIGNFNQQPFFVNVYTDDFHLLPYSPCIDAGNPSSPLDPDGTTADQGAHYFDQNQPQGTCTITLTPFGSTTLPPTGGTIWYGVAVVNSPNYYNLFDGWINMQQPDGQIIPLVLRSNLYLPPSGILNRTLSVTLNSTAMAGTYTVVGYVGEHPNIIEDFDSFTFVKQAGDGLGGEEGTVTIVDGNFVATYPLKSSLPDATRLLGHYPEPFNPQAVISFELHDASSVKLEVYSLSGQKVATLLDRNLAPGVYRETFDGSRLASGMYIYRLQAGQYSASAKMVLLK